MKLLAFTAREITRWMMLIYPGHLVAMPAKLMTRHDLNASFVGMCKTQKKVMTIGKYPKARHFHSYQNTGLALNVTAKASILWLLRTIIK